MGEQQPARHVVFTRVRLGQLRSIVHVCLVASAACLGIVVCWLIVMSLGGTSPLLISAAIATNLAPIIIVLGVLFLIVVLTLVVMVAEQQRVGEEKRVLLRLQQHTSLDHGQLQTILNSISVGIVGVTTTGVIQTYNASFLSLLDTNETLSGRTLSDILPLYDSTTGELINPMDVIKQGTLIRHDNTVLRYSADDEIRLGILVNTIRESSSEPVGYIFIVEDITKEKTLEDERDEFISVVSHELRTPVTVAEGSISNAQLLLERGADMTMLRKTFKDAHDQIVFLSGMINDLSTLSRAERGVGDDVEVIAVDDLASELFSKYAPVALEKNLHLNLDISGRIGRIQTSRLYLEEMLQNFITNAIKYTEKGRITLQIRREKDGVLFAIKDTGIGISTADQKKIFDKFYRSEDYRTRETSGTGLGLYVVRKLAKKLGVTIDVQSRLNHGSTFSFVLPTK